MPVKKRNIEEESSKTTKKLVKNDSKAKRKADNKLKKETRKHIKKLRKEARKRLKRMKKQVKKKIRLFYKFSFFFFLMSFVTIFYFVVLVSVAPKSFPFVTDKIQTYLKENVDSESSIKESRLSFTHHGTLRVAVDELKIFYKALNSDKKQEFVIPRLEGEISLFNLLRLKLIPSKIKVIDPRIVITNLHHMGSESQKEMSEIDQTALIISIIAAIRQEENPIKNLEIENAHFLLKGKQVDTEIVVKNSRIKSYFKDDQMIIHSVNQFSFGNNRPDVFFNANCQSGHDHNFKCSLLLNRFNTKSIVNLHPKLSLLEYIDSTFNIRASFLVNKGSLESFIFNAKAKRGSFEFADFFSKRMDFYDFSVDGEYHADMGLLSFSKIQADFPNETHSTDQDFTHLNMSLSISNLQNPQQRQSDFDIKLKNVLNDEVDKFWPKRLGGDVKSWVLNHLRGGIIKDAYARFTLDQDHKKTILKNMNSQLVFSGVNLNYSRDFPNIRNIDAVAKFSEDDMNIVISKGEVLSSNISEAKVSIPDFNASTPMLKVVGKTQGHAADTLKHASNDKRFTAKVEEYLNGSAKNDFDIQLPLSDRFDLKDIRIEVKSKITNLKNDYVEGAVNIATKKGFGSNNFITEFNFTDAKIHHDLFDIHKNVSDKSGLNVVIAIPDPDHILFKNILLWKKEPLGGGQYMTSKIEGDIAVKTNPFDIYRIELKNKHFGRNNYTLSYVKDRQRFREKLTLKGEILNLSSFIKNKSPFNGAHKQPLHSQYSIAVKDILLDGDRSVSDFSFSLACDGGFCHNGFVIGHYNLKDFISLTISKEKQDKFAKIKGKITDIGYLSEGLDISDKVSAAEIDIDLTNKMVGKSQLVEGSIVANKGITIFESNLVKRLYKDNLFATIKDKIFSSNKIVFDSLKMNISMKEKVLDIKSLVANNYKIGITAKGVFDLNKNSYDIKGMIIPGFIINNLFGIGKVPVIGTVVNSLITGGEGGGIFGISYEYMKREGDKEAVFKTNKVSAFVPTSIRGLFDKI